MPRERVCFFLARYSPPLPASTVLDAEEIILYDSVQHPGIGFPPSNEPH